VLDGKYRDNFGIFVDHKFRFWSRFDMTPGVYVNWYSDFGWNAFPGIDLGYNLTDELRIYANGGKSYRIPTFYDQYYSSPVEQGNPELKPEDAKTFETGMRYMDVKGLSLEGNYFVRNASNLIDWIYNATDSIWISKNIQSVRANGIELSVQLDFNKLFSKEFCITQLAMNYQWLTQQYDKQENVQSRYVLENLRNQVSVSLDHKVVWRIKNSIRARYIDRVEQSPYWIFDDRLYYEAANLSIFLESSNLFDQQYTEVITPMPGRWVRGGITINTKF
jgi:iron complex outermembrane receptor protein